jgi:hypothetical protein
MGDGLLFYRRIVRSGLTEQAHGQRNEEKNDKDGEKDLGDTGRCTGDATEAEDTGDQGDDEEDESIVQHGGSPVAMSAKRVRNAFVPS